MFHNIRKYIAGFTLLIYMFVVTGLSSAFLAHAQPLPSGIDITSGTVDISLELSGGGGGGGFPPPFVGPPAPTAVCSDGLDNDGDGFIDFPTDPGCDSPTDPDETDPPAPPVCSDGLDNDGDGLIDFPNDPGCDSAADPDETDPPIPPVCSDGFDNDGDGFIDFPDDPGCDSAVDPDETDPPPAVLPVAPPIPPALGSQVVNVDDIIPIEDVPVDIDIELTNPAAPFNYVQLYMSKDGGPYQLYTDTAHPTGQFNTLTIPNVPLSLGFYQFYSVVESDTGVLEDPPLGPDEQTNVVSPFVMPTFEMTLDDLTPATETYVRGNYLHFTDPGSPNITKLRFEGEMFDSNPWVFDWHNAGFLLGMEYVPMILNGPYDDNKVLTLYGEDNLGRSGTRQIVVRLLPGDDVDPLPDEEKKLPDATNCEQNYLDKGFKGGDDTDKDGLSNALECKYGTDPFDEDTDDDTFTDSEEVLIYDSDPLDPKSPDPVSFPSVTKITNLFDGLVLSDSRPSVIGFARGAQRVIIYATDEDGNTFEYQRVTTDGRGGYIGIPDRDLKEGYYDFQSISYSDDWKKVIAPSNKVKILIDFSQALPPPIVYAVNEFAFPIAVGDQKTLNRFVSEQSIEIVPAPLTILHGNAFFRSEVQALFKSILTSAALVVDSLEGDFAVAAPERLELGDHIVILYATSDDYVRSQELVIPFTVVPKEKALSLFDWIYVLIIASCITFLIAEYHKRKRREALRLKKKRKEAATAAKGLKKKAKKKVEFRTGKKKDDNEKPKSKKSPPKK